MEKYKQLVEDLDIEPASEKIVELFLNYIVMFHYIILYYIILHYITLCHIILYYAIL